MKSLAKSLRGYKTVIFVDLEGTQFSHEVIEIGAYKAYLNEDLTIKKVARPFRCYVKAKRPVGSFVEKMTGISEKKLREEGCEFPVAQQAFRKYVGKDWFRSIFLTYGNQDAFMMRSSLEHSPEASVEDVRIFCSHNFDFGTFLSSYVRDEKGNVLSLAHACEKLETPFDGTAHDALDDAKNLMSLYSAFVEKKDIVKNHYLHILSQGKMMTPALRKAALRLAKGEDVSSEMFLAWVREELE